MFSLCKEAKPPQVPLFGFANSTPVPLWSRAAQAHGSHGSHGSHGCGYRGVSPCRRPSRRSACRVPQMTWFEQAAHKIVEANPLETYDFYIDLERMPLWSPWLRRVEIDPDDSSLSRWILGFRGFEFSWRARILESRRGQIIRWESVDGFRNRGRVEFSDVSDGRSSSTCVTLAVAFDIPDGVARVSSGISQLWSDSAAGDESDNAAARIMRNTLQADLTRFRDQLLVHVSKKRRQAVRSAMLE